MPGTWAPCSALAMTAAWGHGDVLRHAAAICMSCALPLPAIHAYVLVPHVLRWLISLPVPCATAWFTGCAYVSTRRAVQSPLAAASGPRGVGGEQPAVADETPSVLEAANSRPCSCKLQRRRRQPLTVWRQCNTAAS